MEIHSYHSEVPAPKSVLRLVQVMAKTGLAKSTIYDHIRRGTFPKPIKLGDKVVAWLESEIDEWLFEQLRRSRQVVARKAVEVASHIYASDRA